MKNKEWVSSEDLAPVVFKEGKLLILDQTKLPGESSYLEMKTKEDIWQAIYKLQVRGAPAIGIAAAYGCAFVMGKTQAEDYPSFFREFAGLKTYLNSARPTAVNLSWALNRMQCCAEENQKKSTKEIKEAMLTLAQRIQASEESACKAMGEYGLSLLKPGMGLLTHCNAGALATSKYGTALAPIYLGQEQGYGFSVYADETRPLLQGARLTAFELQRAGVDVTLICDNMAAMVMKQGRIDAVIVGCDRMAANGDGANKIGTAGVAVLAKEYKIPFYMAVPTSTIDLDTKTGEDIQIELRDGEEIYKLWYKKDMAPEGIKTYNPAFDVTEAKYITAVITERGLAYPPYEESLPKLLGGQGSPENFD